MKPPDFTVPDLGPYPLFFGPHEKVEGYYVLDAKERHVGMTVNRAHIFEVECWY